MSPPRAHGDAVLPPPLPTMGPFSVFLPAAGEGLECAPPRFGDSVDRGPREAMWQGWGLGGGVSGYISHVLLFSYKKSK